MMHQSFLQALAKPEPNPGGGAAAAYGASVGFALLEKIVRLERRRQPISSGLYSLWQELLEQSGSLAKALQRLRHEDGEAYLRFAAARASGKGEADINTALEQAIESPLQIMKAACEGVDCVFQAGKHCRKHLLSDLLVVCELLRAAIRGAGWIAEANILMMPDFSLKENYHSKLSQLRETCGNSFRQVESSILERARTAGE
jgi:formiminotetrahydrofolate cyclodeaminase